MADPRAKRILVFTGLWLAVTGALSPQEAFAGFRVPSSRERFEIKSTIIQEKLETVLLPAMRRHGIDMWIVLDRESHLDPLHGELGGGFAGVRGAFAFFDRGDTRPEKIYLSSHSQPANSVISRWYDETKYYGYSPEGLTPLLREAVHKRNPKKIGANISPTLPEADGLSAALKDFLVEAIGPEYSGRLVSAQLVVRDFRTKRIPLETKLYSQLLEWTAQWQSEALSSKYVKPGKTTALDIAWWLEDRALELGLTGYGYVYVVREGKALPMHAPDIPIEPGDIITIDGGLQYLGFETDIKRAAYVLKPGEMEPPQGIQKAWLDTLKIADLYASRMVPGAVGHKVWEDLNAELQERGYEIAYPDAAGRAAAPNRMEVGIYGHSVGNAAHDIGARIAIDRPFAYGDRVRFPLVTGEWVSIEFHVDTPIPEWGGKTWYARFENTAQVRSNGAEGLIPRQEKLLLIDSNSSDPRGAAGSPEEGQQ